MRQLLSLALLLGSVACTPIPAGLRLGVSSEEPGPAIAASIVESLTTAGLPTELVFLETPALVAAAVAAGDVDLALLEEPLAPSPGIGVLQAVYPSVLHVLGPRADRDVPLAQLLQRELYGGPPGSAGQRLAQQLAADFGVPARLLDNPWDSEPQVYFTFGGLLPPDALRQLDGFTLHGLEEASVGAQAPLTGGSIAAAIALRYPNLRPFVLPAALYPTLSSQATTTLAVDTLLVARLDLAEDVAYRVVERVAENAQMVAALYPLARAALRSDVGVGDRTLPLHRGARRYLERNRPSFMERYSDALALLITLTVAAVSATLGLLSHRRRARKDRVDRYLMGVLELRRDQSGKSRQLERLGCIEHEVLQLVVEEKIEADTALVAFLQFCAAARAEIRQV